MITSMRFGTVGMAAVMMASPCIARAASEKVLYSFSYADAAKYPETGLTKLGTLFYGMTGESVTTTQPTVFSVDQTGNFNLLYTFPQSFETDTLGPQPDLLTIGSVLYGTTVAGGTGCGTQGCGTVFSITPAGAYKQIYAFTGGSDGAAPSALIHGGNVLYGTTVSGGAFGGGTLFKLTPAGVLTTLYSFAGGSDGAEPNGLAISKGVFYGTTAQGGGTGCSGGVGCGTVFRLTPDGTETVLHAYTGLAFEGTFSNGNPIVIGGTLYGTTEFGGGGAKCDKSPDGGGTVFKLQLPGAYTTLHAFNCTDGFLPSGGLIKVKGLFYGVTDLFGPNGKAPGEVFSITPGGAFTILYEFQEHVGDGANPVGRLIETGSGLLGTTLGGGAPGVGTVFQITP